MKNTRRPSGDVSPPGDPSLDETDHTLIQRVKAGDQAAFEALFRRNAARVHRQALAIVGGETEAEEVVQEVFITIYTKARQFRRAAAFTT